MGLYSGDELELVPIAHSGSATCDPVMGAAGGEDGNVGKKIPDAGAWASSRFSDWFLTE